MAPGACPASHSSCSRTSSSSAPAACSARAVATSIWRTSSIERNVAGECGRYTARGPGEVVGGEAGTHAEKLARLPNNRTHSAPGAVVRPRHGLLPGGRQRRSARHAALARATCSPRLRRRAAASRSRSATRAAGPRTCRARATSATACARRTRDCASRSPTTQTDGQLAAELQAELGYVRSPAFPDARLLHAAQRARDRPLARPVLAEGAARPGHRRRHPGRRPGRLGRCDEGLHRCGAGRAASRPSRTTPPT